MPRVCAITGKKTRFLKTSTRRGSAKRKGGVGLKQTGVHQRSQKPNLQKKTLSLWVGGTPRRVWLSTAALRTLDQTLLPSSPRGRRGS